MTAPAQHPQPVHTFAAEVAAKFAACLWPERRDHVLLCDDVVADVTGLPFHWFVNLPERQRLGIPFHAG